MANQLLKQGSRGDSVKQLQTFLNQQGYSAGKADGIYGTNTASAVRQYQKAQGLSADGIVGKNTWGAINSTSSPSNSSSSSGSISSSSSSSSSAPQGLIDFTPRSEADLRKEAENIVNPLYNAEVEAVNQATERNRQALERQADSLYDVYGKHEEDTKEYYGQERQRASDQSLKRGLARSNIATNDQQKLTVAEAKRLGELQDSLTGDINTINEQITLLEGQLSDSLKRLDIDKASQIQSRIDELRSEQDDKQYQITQINNTYLADQRDFQHQQEQFSYQQEQDRIAKDRWQTEFDWKKYMDQENLKLQKQNAARAASRSSASRSSASRSSDGGSNASAYSLAYDDIFNSSNPGKTYRNKRNQYSQLLTSQEMTSLNSAVQDWRKKQSKQNPSANKVKSTAPKRGPKRGPYVMPY